MKKYWHFIFICLCILMCVFVSFDQYHKRELNLKMQHNVCNGHLSANEIHKNGILILCYHKVLSNSWNNEIAEQISNNTELHEYQTPINTLRKQVKYFQKHHVHIISIKEAFHLARTQKKLNHQYVVFTFDDFDNTVYQNVYPFFKKENLPYTAFVIMGKTGEYDAGEALTNWQEIQTMEKNSKVTFGLHTYDMHYLIHSKSALTFRSNFKAFQKDYFHSQRVMYKHLHYHGQFFAYPYGEYTAQVQKFLADQGIITFSLDNTLLTPDTNLKQPVGRTLVSQGTWDNVIEKWVR